MATMETILHIIDILLFVCTGIAVAYLLVFALASIPERKYKYPETTRKYRYAVLFPAYKEDKVILASIEAFLKQEYPRSHYQVVVISDQMKDETNEQLAQMGATVLQANYTDSSKAKALQLAMNSLDETAYDVVVIMDGDNIVEPNFLEEVNKAYHTGCKAIQTHRVAKNRNTATALLDAVSEEINNSIFRKGHVKLGLSAALIGSGMVFEYKWFRKNIFRASTAGEDKELEAFLLEQRIYIDYLNHVKVYDEKVPKDDTFYNQRRRWQAATYEALAQALPKLPKALIAANWDYCNKVFQWMLPPRVILLEATGVFTILASCYNWAMSLKWWILLAVLISTLFIAIPSYLIDKNFGRALFKVPKLGFLMFLNLFRLRGVNKKFIHTHHES